MKHSIEKPFSKKESNIISNQDLRSGAGIYNAIKAPQWYAVKGSDTTMLPKAASLPGQ